MKGKIFSAGAWMAMARSTRKSFGRVAARPRTARIATARMIATTRMTVSIGSSGRLTRSCVWRRAGRLGRRALPAQPIEMLADMGRLGGAVGERDRLVEGGAGLLDAAELLQEG